MTFFLDTETTGLSKDEGAELVEIALLDDTGKVWCDTLVKPRNPIPPASTAVHGITDEMVQNAPWTEAILGAIYNIVEGHDLVIYNAPFDSQWLPDIADICNVKDAMLEFAPIFGRWDEKREAYKWVSLSQACSFIGYVLPPEYKPHRALADCIATKAVWNFIQDRKNSF